MPRNPLTASCRRLSLTLLLTFAALTASARGESWNRKVHGWLWTVNDGAGFRWDINYNGTVNDGSNDAYDSGMSLRVKGRQIPSRQKTAALRSDGREIRLTPQTYNNIRVTRRIYIDPKLGYARWIDLFENKSNTNQVVQVEYYSNLGSSISHIWSRSGKSSPTQTDDAFVTSSSSSSRPAIIHIYASPNARVRPPVR